jgi:hypothetical protein
MTSDGRMTRAQAMPRRISRATALSSSDGSGPALVHVD